MTSELQELLTGKKSDDYKIITATVASIGDNGATVKSAVDGNTYLLPRHEAYENTLKLGNTFPVIELPSHDSQKLVSQNAPGMITAAASLVVPELRDGTVSIRSVYRIPGVRAKIAVASSEEGNDPIAAFLGKSSNRMKALSAYLGGERIDVIAWHADRISLLRNAFSPAPVSWILRQGRRAIVGVPGHLMSTAVGEGGLNSSLAGRTAGLTVKVVRENSSVDDIAKEATEFLRVSEEDAVKALTEIKATSEFSVKSLEKQHHNEENSSDEAEVESTNDAETNEHGIVGEEVEFDFDMEF